jgi:hypothetical protein
MHEEPEWAPWLNVLEQSTIRPDKRLEFYNKVADHVVSSPADLFIVFPDASIHYGFAGRVANKPYNDPDYFNDEVEWLVDPLKKTMDIIWQRKDTTIYMGPNSKLLLDNKIDPQTFYGLSQ